MVLLVFIGEFRQVNGADPQDSVNLLTEHQNWLKEQQLVLNELAAQKKVYEPGDTKESIQAKIRFNNAALEETNKIKNEIHQRHQVLSMRYERMQQNAKHEEDQHRLMIDRWSELKDLHTDGGTKNIPCHDEHQQAIKDARAIPTFMECSNKVLACKQQHPELLGEHFEQYKACLNKAGLVARRRRR
jgi:hypothetical protein